MFWNSVRLFPILIPKILPTLITRFAKMFRLLGLDRATIHLADGMCPRIYSISNQMVLALCSVEQAQDLLRWQLRSAHFIDGAEVHTQLSSNDQEQFQPPGLIIIHRFASRLWRSQEYKQGKRIVVCAGIHPESITNTALLIGGFMLLSQGLELVQVLAAFGSISSMFVSYADQITVSSCLSAIQSARSSGWLRIEAEPLPGSATSPSMTSASAIDMDEFAHYDSPLNGGFHEVVPGKLLAFDCPAHLPADLPWEDSGGSRRFGPVFYADIFSELGVDVVVRAGACNYGAAAFQARGIGVEDLLLDAAPPTLAQIDRFLSLARQAPGAIAVHGGPGGLGAAGTLIAVWLISAHRFRAAEALAWVRMAHPAGLPTAHQRFLQDAEERMRRRQGLGRISHSFTPTLGFGLSESVGDGGSSESVELVGGTRGPGRGAITDGPALKSGRSGAGQGVAAAGGGGGGGIEAGPPRCVAEPRIFDFLGGGGGDSEEGCPPAPGRPCTVGSGGCASGDAGDAGGAQETCGHPSP